MDSHRTDMAMAIAAYTLARLTEARQPVEEIGLSLTAALQTGGRGPSLGDPGWPE